MTFTAIALAAAMAVVTAVAPEQAPRDAAGARCRAGETAPCRASRPCRSSSRLPTIDPAYVYEPAGRRDPFISLVGRGDDKSAPTVRPAGLAGLLIGEITVKGVVRDRNGFTRAAAGAGQQDLHRRVRATSSSTAA